MFNQGQFPDMSAQLGQAGAQQQWAPQPQMGEQVPPVAEELEDNDNSHRPPNAFILYSQAMRTQVRVDNPSLSNTECSRLLGKMWKEVSADVKLQYKQKAAAMQEAFKREHPNYTYRKARRKRALNELLAKTPQGFPPMAGVMPEGFQQWSQMQAFQPGMQGLQGLPGMAGMQGMQGIPGMQPQQGLGSQPMQGLPQMQGMFMQPQQGGQSQPQAQMFGNQMQFQTQGMPQ